MNIPNELVLGATATAFAISMAFWIYLLKFKLSETGKDIEAAVDKKAEGYIKEFKKDFEEGVADLKKEIPIMIAVEVPKLLEKEGPKLVDTILTGFADRVADPKDEKMPILLSTMAFQGMAAFRACMADADFKREVDDFINGKMNKVASQLETRLPGIFVKAAPEIKNAILSGGGGKEGDGLGGILGMLGINLENIGGGFG